MQQDIRKLASDDDEVHLRAFESLLLQGKESPNELLPILAKYWDDRDSAIRRSCRELSLEILSRQEVPGSSSLRALLHRLFSAPNEIGNCYPPLQEVCYRSSGLLQALLEHPNPQVRTACLLAVWEHRSVNDTVREVLPSIQDCLKDPEASVRRAAVLSYSVLLREDEDPCMVLDLLADPDPEVRNAVIHPFGMHAQCELPKKALMLLEHPDPGVRVSALEALRQRMRKEDLPGMPNLLAKLDDSDASVRRMAIQCLCDFRNELPLKPYMSRVIPLLADPDPGCRALALTFCGHLRDLPGKEPVRALLVDPVPEVRASALRALRDLGERPATDVLRRFVQDPSKEVRISALSRLDFADRAVAPFVRPLLNNADEEIVVWACGASGLFMDREALPSLLEILKSKDARRRSAAANAIVLIRDPSTLNQVLHLLPNSDSSAVCVMILTQIGDRSIASKLVEYMSHPDEEVRESALWIYSKHGSPEGREAMRACLKDPSPKVRAAAEFALKTLGCYPSP